MPCFLALRSIFSLVVLPSILHFSPIVFTQLCYGKTWQVISKISVEKFAKKKGNGKHFVALQVKLIAGDTCIVYQSPSDSASCHRARDAADDVSSTWISAIRMGYTEARNSWLLGQPWLL